MDQHGGQSIPNFDYGLAPGVAKTFIKVYKDNLKKALMLMLNYEENKAIEIVDICVPDYETNQYPPLDEELYFQDYKAYEYGTLFSYLDNKDKIDDIQRFVYKMAKQETIKKTYQAMEGFLHNLNTMHSRAGVA